MKVLQPKRIAIGITLLLALLPHAHAQYKYVAADGSITYSDRPPPTDAKKVQRNSVGGMVDTGKTEDDLPFAIKTAMQKHPVVVYSAPDCAPCDQLKQHLQKRGTPFSEKLVRNNGDLNALKALGIVDSSFPSLTIGSQKQNGFEPGALDNMLDLAGYPKSVKLPAGYRGSSEPLTAELSKPSQIAGAEQVKPKTKVKSEAAKPAPAPVAEPKPLIRF
jgi:glutaredoxin